MLNLGPLQVWAQDMATQSNREVIALINPNVDMEVTRVRSFTRMNPFMFNGSKVNEYP